VVDVSDVRPPLPGAAVARYLAVLGVAPRPPSPAGLHELVAAHVTRVPFENVSKLYRRNRLGLTALPPLRLFLDGIERDRLGGTCYSNNCHLWSLLVSLGYEATLCGADMSAPDVHAVILVALHGREYLVDAGYGAPFLSALPRDAGTDQVVAWGHERFVLKPRDAAGCSRLELHRGGAVRHGYLAKPAPRRPADFERVIADSFGPGATFMNAVAFYRFERDGAVLLRNLSLLEATRESSTTRALRDLDEVASVLRVRFGVPGEIVAEALRGLGPLHQEWT
jgi:arylamine N-acetyltransferase